MMKYSILILTDEIEEELANVEELQNNLKLSRGKDLDEDSKRRVYASILEDFYMAVEKIFKIVARDIDHNLPDNGAWHKKLLRQMSIKISDTRPALIDKKLFHKFEEYLKFRHLIHNIYGFQLQLERFLPLVKEMDNVAEEFKKQVTSFLEKMQEIAQEIEEE